MGPLDTWRTATSVLPRRTALRLLGASALTVALAACSGKGAPGLNAVALGKFAAGTWKVSAPDANYPEWTITVTEDGTWKGEYPADDGSGSTSVHTDSGSWSLAGQALHVTFEDGDHTAEASQVPEQVGGDASAQFTWTFGQRADGMRATYTAGNKTLVLVRAGHGGDQTITAVRA
ncbi:lipocalin family protein [Kitasatospora sp. NA04385]|uniref:lipocalin family protein n=1 Tax=Kitasatospora sp. NA04385 TaxID=2742135 RepID=UPI00158FB1BF|nr:lipocalin family protein [Kitasatospora sp. NA04385]QKW18520.1 lipocalin family protein [Kitasatospora sp. NA04385]